MGMNATLLEKYGERRATVRSACITIVTCYKYAPFFAPKMALLKTTFFTKYLDLRGPKLMAKDGLRKGITCASVSLLFYWDIPMKKV